MEPIRNRRPTEADANAIEQVLVWSRDQWLADHIGNVRDGDIWKPIDQTPPPPEPEKPKRGKWYDLKFLRDGKSVDVLEILPGDPPDLDTFLQLFDWALLTYDMDDIPVETWKKLKAARHGEGGE